MTELTKVVKRKLPRPIDRGIWTVAMDSTGITFRQSKKWKRFPIGWEAIWCRAMEIAAEQLRKERAAARKARKAW